jgi:hypothetical protein
MNALLERNRDLATAAIADIVSISDRHAQEIVG